MLVVYVDDIAIRGDDTKGTPEKVFVKVLSNQESLIPEVLLRH